MPGFDLLFGFLFADFSDTRTDRPRRNSSGGEISAAGGAIARAMATAVVYAYSAVVFERLAHADGILLDWHHCFRAAGAESVAARDARHLFHLLPFVHQRGPRFFKLSVGWHVARGGNHLFVLRSWGILVRIRGSESALPGEFISAAMGVVPHLLSVRRGETAQS